LAYYKETLRVERASLGKHHKDAITTLEHIGRVYQTRGELHEALECFEEAVELRMTREQPERDHFGIAQTYNDIGNVHLQMGHTFELMEAFANATRQFRMAGQSEEELVITGFNYFGLSKMHPEAAATA